MKHLRVLQISHDYEGPFRSICRQYASAFEGHDVTTVYVCGKYDSNILKETGGDEVLFFERPNRAMRGIKFATLFKFARLFRERRFDVVIAHRYKSIYFAGIMSYFFPIPVLLGVIHEHQVLKRLSRRLFITFWRRNIICIGVSESVSRNIERYCGSLGLKGRLHNLPHAMDVERESLLLEQVEARRRLGVPQGVFCFGTVGRLVAKKEHHVLLDAFREFRAAGREAVLVIIGAGPEEQKLRAYVAEHELEDDVLFTGHVPDAWRYMKALDVFVLPSGTAEAFGIVLLEAMLACVPIISTDAPGPAEVVGDSAILFGTGDAEDLARKLALARDIPNEKRKVMERAGWQRLLQGYSLATFRERMWAIPAIRRLVMDDR